MSVTNSVFLLAIIAMPIDRAYCKLLLMHITCLVEIIRCIYYNPQIMTIDAARVQIQSARGVYRSTCSIER